MKRTFVISAYYSPITGQAKYVTGSYAGDIRLNGGGVHGADGTNVYAGMIAAPKNYPFGTKIDIPGIGMTAVHDRGGAIVNIGQRGYSYDRLDVWMGYGDAGLTRALKWGKRTVTTTVYGIDSSVTENASFEGYSATEKNGTTANNTSSSVTAETKKDVNFVSNLAYGTVSEDVAKVQTILKNLNYYDGEINSKFDAKTLAAVKKFQLDYDIIYTENDYGAGYIGPKTIKVLASKMNVTVANAAEETILPASAFVRDLKPGDSGDDVRELQEELKKLNLFGVETTGNYGETTEHAVFKFQQIQRLAGDKNSTGAGIFGTKTRTSLNLLIAERERINKMRKDVI
jgi:peptidoglycan hydrolase-like protein with peptidoglycan-binding domain/3D (Asp-Asp-Asp) domain-containing protein